MSSIDFDQTEVATKMVCDSYFQACLNYISDLSTRQQEVVIHFTTWLYASDSLKFFSSILFCLLFSVSTDFMPVWTGEPEGTLNILNFYSFRLTQKYFEF